MANSPDFSRVERLIPAVILSLLALVQMALFVVAGDPLARAAGIVLGAATLVVALAPRRWGSLRLPLMWALALAIAINLARHVASIEPPFPHRLLEAAAVLGYGGALTALLAGLLLRGRFADALLVTMSVAAAVWLAEAVWPSPERTGVRWVGSLQPHPELGEKYRPYSRIMTLYPDNPRGYFEERNPLELRWLLDIHVEGNEASLSFSGKAMRVNIARATPALWHIQLREPGLALTKGVAYAVEFRARADSPRKFGVGVRQAHPPWDSIGLYSEEDLTAEWRLFQYRFVPPVDEQNAQLHFDLGKGSSVEIADLSIRRVEDGASIEFDRKEYSVTYRFNALGCRGEDYAIPRPPAIRRILAIGDSYTLGVGVHEPDTFERRLEESLNSKRTVADARYQVINCGVSGYGTREERLFYELFGSRYQPDIVLLTMIDNDDRSWREDVRLGYYRSPGRMEHLLTSWALIQQYRYQRPDPDYRPVLAEVLRLQEACRRQNARLAVIVFRDYESREDTKLLSTMKAGLNGKGIPVVDLGPALEREHPFGELVVHPLDRHPNEIAHRIAAEEIEKLLRKEGWVE
jgi:hypothetical protein